MRVLYINNDGGGFADHIELAAGTTIDQLFHEKLPSCKPQDYLIRVNRQSVTAGQTLQDGDRVTITPVKIEGAV